MPDERRLAAIMFTDIVGYTSLSQTNEALALELLGEQRRIVRSVFPRHGGSEVKTIGDAFLIEHESALEALRCAFDIQQAMHDLNSSRPAERRVQLRVGIHLGDVIHTENDVYGDAVNVASRIEPLASPGGVCISQQVFDNVRNKSDILLTSMGKRELKNVQEPVEVYRVAFPWEKAEESKMSLDRKRVAVLPFDNLSSNPEEGYFADGMTEELITSLSGVRQLTVIARTSVMKYKGSQKGASEVGKELSVGSLLEGSVRKAGNRVRITAQLIDTETEGHLWAQNYDRQLEDVFAIQSEIAEKVAEELRIRLVDDEIRVIEKKATENTEAYMSYLQGRELLRQGSDPSVRQALRVFEKVVAMDPTFARAHAGIAEAYTSLVNDGTEAYEIAAPKAELSVKRALQLDPDLAEAHATLADVYFLEDQTFLCEQEANRAVQLNPSLADAYDILASMAFIKGEGDEGLRRLETCYKIDPAKPAIIERLGQFYFFLGREEDALKLWEETANMAQAATNRNLAEYYIYKGDLEKGKECFRRAEQLEPTSRWVTWMRGYLAARTGDVQGAKAVIEWIEKEWLGATNLNDIGFIYYGLGDMDSYFAYVDRATEQHVLRYRYVMYCPLFADARKDPRYKEFLAKVDRLLFSRPTQASSV